MKKIRLQELFLFGFVNLAAGMFFGTGCVIVEHADNILWPTEDTAQEKTATEPTATPHSATAVTNIASHH